MDEKHEDLVGLLAPFAGGREGAIEALTAARILPTQSFTYRLSGLRATDDWFLLLAALRDGREISVGCTDTDCDCEGTGVPRSLFVTDDGHMAATVGDHVFWSDTTRKT